MAEATAATQKPEKELTFEEKYAQAQELARLDEEARKNLWNAHTGNYSSAKKRMMFTPATMKEAPSYSVYKNKNYYADTNYGSDFLNDAAFEKHQWNYKKDSTETGWAPGMDDLARIVLDNKGAVKFNKKLITPDGAMYWVKQKNKTIPDDKKKWRVVYQDVNNDNVPEVLVIDGDGNVRYLNGWHIGKKNMDLIRLHQDYIDEHYGDPKAISIARSQGNIRKGELKMQTWLDSKQRLNPNNPMGPYEADDDLVKAGYKPRALNPCNLFLRFVIKDLYDRILATVTTDAFYQKLVKKLVSVIQINAKMYTKYIAEPSRLACKKEGYTEKSMRKRTGNEAFSPFSKKCGSYIEYFQKADDANELKAVLIADIKKALTECYNKVATLKAGPYLGVEEPKRVDKRAGQAWNRDAWEATTYAY